MKLATNSRMADAADFVAPDPWGCFGRRYERRAGRCTRDDQKRPRANVYADSVGFGPGNELVFVGTLAAFIASNPNIDLAPPAQFV